MVSKDQPQENNDLTARYFDSFGLGEWDRLVKTPVDEVNLYIHTHYLQEHISPGWRLLEIGAGAGRFTQVLAGLGAQLTVADISQVQLDLNKQHAQRYGFSHAVESWDRVDICHMKRYSSGSFDAVVAYGGPLSFVLDQRDTALHECKRVLKRPGILLLSVMSLWGSAHRHLNGVLKIPIEKNQVVTASGDLSPALFPERDVFMHMFRAAELRDWLVAAGLKVTAMSASNCLSTGWEDLLQDIRLDEKKWDELLRMELEACKEAATLNMGTHIIAVAEKHET